MYLARCNEGTFTIKSPSLSRKIVCPKAKEEKLEKGKYYFDKETKLKNDLVSFPISEKWVKMDDRLMTRIWSAFWDEGWREKKR